MGILIAASVLTAWALHLAVWLLADVPLVWAPIGVLVQTQLDTGLFITAHDAMHGTVAPGRPRLNDAIGRVATALYAAFSFDTLRAAHRLHHAHPGTVDADPDFHRGDARFGAWFVAFLRGYVTVRQVLCMALAYNVAARAFGVAEPRLVAFWIVPSLLSTVQLFTFGTWQPHRPGAGLDAVHHARTDEGPAWRTWLACWHFGVHRLHHEAPHLPWWRLHAEGRLATHPRVG